MGKYLIPLSLALFFNAINNIEEKKAENTFEYIKRQYMDDLKHGNSPKTDWKSYSSAKLEIEIKEGVELCVSFVNARYIKDLKTICLNDYDEISDFEINRILDLVTAIQISKKNETWEISELGDLILNEESLLLKLSSYDDYLTFSLDDGVISLDFMSMRDSSYKMDLLNKLSLRDDLIAVDEQRFEFKSLQREIPLSLAFQAMDIEVSSDILSLLVKNNQILGDGLKELKKELKIKSDSVYLENIQEALLF